MGITAIMRRWMGSPAVHGPQVARWVPPRQMQVAAQKIITDTNVPNQYTPIPLWAQHCWTVAYRLRALHRISRSLSQIIRPHQPLNHSRVLSTALAANIENLRWMPGGQSVIELAQFGYGVSRFAVLYRQTEKFAETRAELGAIWRKTYLDPTKQTTSSRIMMIATTSFRLLADGFRIIEAMWDAHDALLGSDPSTQAEALNAASYATFEAVRTFAVTNQGSLAHLLNRHRALADKVIKDFNLPPSLSTSMGQICELFEKVSACPRLDSPEGREKMRLLAQMYDTPVRV